MKRFPLPGCASRLVQFTIETNLKQPQEFEDNHDNDDHSDYVEYASVHASDSYQTECVVASIINTEWSAGGPPVKPSTVLKGGGLLSALLILPTPAHQTKCHLTC
jgi:hypothetical protein